MEDAGKLSQVHFCIARRASYASGPYALGPDGWPLQGYETAMKNLAIIITGGTLDKVHDTLTESLGFAKDGKSRVDGVLRIGRCDFPRLIQIMQKDSLDMDSEDRAQISGAIEDANERAIVVTHGTGTLEQTAQYLDGKTGDKTVILTGAMRPFSLGKSDAGFNLGGAIAAAQILPAGVYGVMNGRIFAAEEIHKDTKRGRFD